MPLLTDMVIYGQHICFWPTWLLLADMAVFSRKSHFDVGISTLSIEHSCFCFNPHSHFWLIWHISAITDTLNSNSEWA
jgi:hypothetical protein